MNQSTQVALPRTRAFAGLFYEHPLEGSTRKAVLAVIAILLFSYAYLAVASVLHAVAERTTAAMVNAEKTVLAELEREYFTLASDVDQSRADEFGLARTSDKHFVTRSSRLTDARGL